MLGGGVLERERGVGAERGLGDRGDVAMMGDWLDVDADVSFASDRDEDDIAGMRQVEVDPYMARESRLAVDGLVDLDAPAQDAAEQGSPCDERDRRRTTERLGVPSLTRCEHGCLGELGDSAARHRDVGSADHACFAAGWVATW